MPKNHGQITEMVGSTKCYCSVHSSRAQVATMSTGKQLRRACSFLLTMHSASCCAPFTLEAPCCAAGEAPICAGADSTDTLEAGVMAPPSEGARPSTTFTTLNRDSLRLRSFVKAASGADAAIAASSAESATFAAIAAAAVVAAAAAAAAAGAAAGASSSPWVDDVCTGDAHSPSVVIRPRSLSPVTRAAWVAATAAGSVSRAVTASTVRLRSLSAAGAATASAGTSISQQMLR